MQITPLHEFYYWECSGKFLLANEGDKYCKEIDAYKPKDSSTDWLLECVLKIKKKMNYLK